jgi:hypothetical protein
MPAELTLGPTNLAVKLCEHLVEPRLEAGALIGIGESVDALLHRGERSPLLAQLAEPRR